MGFWKQVQYILTLLRDFTGIHVIKPLQYKKYILIIISYSFNLNMKLYHSECYDEITSVYFPSRNDLWPLIWVSDVRIGKQGGDWKTVQITISWSIVIAYSSRYFKTNRRRKGKIAHRSEANPISRRGTQNRSIPIER